MTPPSPSARVDRSRVASFLLWTLGRLPLRVLRAVGQVLGWIVYMSSCGYRNKIRANLRRAGLDSPPMRWRAAGEAGRAVGELPWVWTRPLTRLVERVHCDDADLQVFERTLHRGGGVLFLTPHLGSFEVAASWHSARAPITVLYKPPRKSWLRPFIARVRDRAQLSAVPPTTGGLRRLLRALRAGEAVGLLPDQVPAAGDGRWAPFFGEPAYTMTLPERLAAQTGAAVVVAVCERVSRPAGWRLRLEEMHERPEPEALNRCLQRWILHRPEQYLWGYNRYRRPAAAPARPGAQADAAVDAGRAAGAANAAVPTEAANPDSADAG